MLPNGRHKLGPDTGTLQVRTSREGAYAKAGHDLVMDVTSWEATLDVSGDAVTLEMNVDPQSLHVRWGFNGSTSLTDQNRDDISRTIHTKVLNGAAISFRSKSVTPYGEALMISGELTIGQTSRTINFELRPTPDGSRIDATARIIQSDFGIKPYSAMLGTLKVRNSVEIVARATFPPAWARSVVSEPEVPETTVAEPLESVEYEGHDIVEPEAPEPSEYESEAPEPVLAHWLDTSEHESLDAAVAEALDTPESEPLEVAVAQWLETSESEAIDRNGAENETPVVPVEHWLQTSDYEVPETIVPEPASMAMDSAPAAAQWPETSEHEASGTNGAETHWLQTPDYHVSETIEPEPEPVPVATEPALPEPADPEPSPAMAGPKPTFAERAMAARSRWRIKL